jgi:hypothetical protein
VSNLAERLSSTNHAIPIQFSHRIFHLLRLVCRIGSHVRHWGCLPVLADKAKYHAYCSCQGIDHKALWRYVSAAAEAGFGPGEQRTTEQLAAFVHDRSPWKVADHASIPLTKHGGTCILWNSPAQLSA